MGTISWLHLSDWHQSGGSYYQNLTSDSLVRDIANRKTIDERLSHIDCFLFSGDIAFSGARHEFDQAKRTLIDPIRRKIGNDVPIFCVPGNHDIDRGRIGAISEKLRSRAAQLKTDEQWQEFNELMTQPATVKEFNGPLSNYFDFLEALGCKSDRSKLHSVERIKKDGAEIGIIGINTAWNSARFHVRHADHDTDTWLWDYGFLRITEAQLRAAISELGEGTDLTILMMHHPLHWIDELERARLEQMLFRHCHIVIHGHEHRPNSSRISSAFGDLIFIPAGATYAGPTPADPRYTNAYNFGIVDTQTLIGTIHHRIWSAINGRWEPDERFWSNGQSQFVLAKEKDYDLKLAHKATISSLKQYIGFLPNRVALEHELTIRHDDELVDGEHFIRQHVKIRTKVRAGPPEEFQRSTGVDSMIVDHPNPKVRERAYKLINLDPPMDKVMQSDNTLHVWKSILDRKEHWLEYEYEKLDLPSNFYYARISRFTERVKLSIRQANGYKYDYLPIGGFPALRPKRNMYQVDTLETDEMILPSQGYIFQWRPEHKFAKAGEGTGQKKPPAKSSRRRKRSRR